MITFKDYTSRRGLTIQNFQHLQYEEYQKWCAIRKIQPVDRLEFERDLNSFVETQQAEEYGTPDDLTLEPEIVVEPVTVAVQINPIDWKGLQKKRKSDIQAMCDSRNISYQDETKRQLISKLKEFEGIE
jgi:hypothetical protein